MAAGKEAVSFDAIIQADRQKRKNEALANEILVKNRRASAPGSGVGNRKQAAAPGSLASRIGVAKPAAKRSASTSLKSKSTASARSSRTTENTRRAREERLLAVMDSDNGQATIRDKDVGITIKGTGSGPFVVLGSNFAPGTTAADIQSALEPFAGEIISCRITSQYPTVTAEIACADRRGAENVVANFHNQKADGRILSMRLKNSTFASTSTFNPPTGPRALSNQASQNSYDGLREQADRERRENRRADPQIQDGTCGFDEPNGQSRNGRGNARFARRENGPSRNGQQERGLYSDEMMVDAPAQGSRRGRGFR
ncbi:hypothetical protein VTN77DRAFT_3574 [Rasamsonia byssochlamydoides]|uniref:uncharacterized protein n=1 Tax=Rasamsonia byssochlamydoides TaxID=89139 RepID=UPI00374356CB